MKDTGRLFWLVVGVVMGGVGVAYLVSRPAEVKASSNDRFEDYVLTTGAVNLGPKGASEGVWLLDYRAGKLLGTAIDRNQGGKVTGWAEVDLVTEFGIQPRANVHFLMTTGQVTPGQSALYVAETTSGKFGVYTMSARADGEEGIMIKRHDLVLFRQKK
jgi:hypothetical protein